MVILRGIVRSGTASTEDADSYIANAAIIQLSSAVYTSSNGTFYTSALTLDVATCQAAEYATVQYSIPDFATIYDPAGVVSGALTVNADITTISGASIMTDTHKLFMSGALIGRALTMMDGVYDGFSGTVTANTQNTFTVGGGYVTSGTAFPQVENVLSMFKTITSDYKIRSYHSATATPDSKIILMGGKTSGAIYLNDVWISDNIISSWTLQTASASWSGRIYHTGVMVSGTIVLTGGENTSAYFADVWTSVDNGANWTEQTAPPWGVRTRHTSVALSGSVVVIGGKNASSSLYDVWSSPDFGANWTCMTSNGLTSFGNTTLNQASILSGDIIVSVNGASSKRDVWRSRNGGSTWTCLTSSAEYTPRVQWHNMVAMSDGSLLVFGAYGSTDIWRSTDGGSHWIESPYVFEQSKFDSHTVGYQSVVISGISYTTGGFSDYITRYYNEVCKIYITRPTPPKLTNLTSSGMPAVGGITGVRYSPNGDYVAVSADDVDVLKKSGDVYTNIRTLTSGNDLWNEMCWSPDSNYLAVFKTQGVVPYELFYKRTGDTFTQVGTFSGSKATDTCAWNPVYDEIYQYVGYTSNAIRFYTRSGDVFTYVPGGAGMNTSLLGWGRLIAVSPDGNHIAVGDWTAAGDGWACIRIFERAGAGSYTLIQTLQMDTVKFKSRYMYGGSYSPDGKYFIATIYGLSINSIRAFIVNVDGTFTGIPDAVDYVEYYTSPRSVSFSPDGKLVTTHDEHWGYYVAVMPYYFSTSGYLTYFDAVKAMGIEPYPIYDLSFATSGTMHLFLGDSNDHNYLMKYEMPPVPTSSFVTIAASSGDIYNIGGISGESTTNIVFTLWDNKAYGRERGK